MIESDKVRICFNCKENNLQSDQYKKCLCEITYCSKCITSNQHKKVCSDCFHVRVKKVINMVEKGCGVIINTGNGLSCNDLHIKYRDIPFKTSLFPHVTNNGISNCIICGKLNNNLKFRLIRRSRNNQHYKHHNNNHYHADICNECHSNNLFICSHTYLPSDKCMGGKWHKSKLCSMITLSNLGFIPTDVVKYIYEYMLSIDKNMSILSLKINKHTCSRHFDTINSY